MSVRCTIKKFELEISTMHPSKQTFTRRDFLATTAGISMLAGGAMPAPAAPQAARPSGALWPPFEKLQARLEQWQGDFKSLCEVEILGKSAQGRPLYAARLTDSSAPDEDKEHVLLTALHSGIERSGTTSLFSMMRWLLLSGDPVAHEILRRQIVIVMPVPNPDGYVLGSSSNTADLWAYQSWTLNGPMNPECSAVSSTCSLSSSGAEESVSRAAYSGLPCADLPRISTSQSDLKSPCHCSKRACNFSKGSKGSRRSCGLRGRRCWHGASSRRRNSGSSRQGIHGV